MRSRSVLAACGLAVLVGVSAMAQSAAPGASSSQQTSSKTPAGGLVPGAPPLQLENLPPEQHTLTPAQQAQVRRAQEYRAAIQVANLTARWGPAMSTPGVSVTLVQTARTKTASGPTQFTYQIAGTGFRAGEKLNLVRWPLGERVKAVIGGLVLNRQGIAVCGASAPAKSPPSSAPADQPGAPATSLSAAPVPVIGSAPPQPAGPPSCAETMQPNQPVEIHTTAAPGEAIRAALIGEDRSNGAATQTVPFPIADTDKSCSLQVLLGMRDADMVVVEGTGFPPDATLKIETVTGNQSRLLKARTNPAGRMAMAVLPGIAGQTAGTSTVRYAGMVAPASPATGGAAKPSAAAAPTPSPVGADAGCAPAVSFHWGPDSYKPE
ncbi:MAG TPA: hypothetical protein VME18_06775 [Acidobacteriaceae bacterium]|nr:hypothetical protein [Acidobacteriaceae bacterium]